MTIEQNDYVESDEFTDAYQIAGTGLCSAPASGAAGAYGDVLVAPFAFRRTR